MSANPAPTNSGIKGISQDVRKFIEKRLELFILTFSEQVTYILAGSIQRVIGILMLGGGFMFAWFALCYYLGTLVDSNALGFLLGSIPLIVAGFTFLKMKPKAVTRKIQAGMVQEVLQSLDNMADKVVDTDGKQEQSKDKSNKGD
ncbi:MAG: hypothetical protein WEC12_00950 [Balneolaceae bacterium]